MLYGVQPSEGRAQCYVAFNIRRAVANVLRRSTFVGPCPMLCGPSSFHHNLCGRRGQFSQAARPVDPRVPAAPLVDDEMGGRLSSWVRAFACKKPPSRRAQTVIAL